ncbi:hypothetical protein C9374_012395 [Naegleria lovaniensis]|uniref:Uncharacterized protein n=1 Tax=Naegleria lovaniensis TaxID=51637 RepID=A0AA88GZP5_NAELO|nr:uncharacterized protein C9374_012395 [Naegleria lovaniensis]KAG2392143.1 hypothetical protein C9374_012395 [Naegleria lovaniensis]
MISSQNENHHLRQDHLEEIFWNLKAEFGGGKNLSESSFQPPLYEKDINLVDPLQQFAYHSLKYDHLGGPPDYYIRELKRRQKQRQSNGNSNGMSPPIQDNDDEQWVVVLEQNLHPNRTLVNPNHAWDASSNVAPLMRRIFQFDNLLHFVTVLMHVGLIIPLITNMMGLGGKLKELNDALIRRDRMIRGGGRMNDTSRGIIQYLVQFFARKWLSSGVK